MIQFTFVILNRFIKKVNKKVYRIKFAKIYKITIFVTIVTGFVGEILLATLLAKILLATPRKYYRRYPVVYHAKKTLLAFPFMDFYWLRQENTAYVPFFLDSHWLYRQIAPYLDYRGV